MERESCANIDPTLFVFRLQFILRHSEESDTAFALSRTRSISQSPLQWYFS